MTENENYSHKVVYKTKDGHEKVYIYNPHKYYENMKEKTANIVCSNCGSCVMSNYLGKHQTMKKCINHHNKKLRGEKNY